MKLEVSPKGLASRQGRRQKAQVKGRGGKRSRGGKRGKINTTITLSTPITFDF
jgi:hypothetical protein